MMNRQAQLRFRKEKERPGNHRWVVLVSVGLQGAGIDNEKGQRWSPLARRSSGAAQAVTATMFQLQFRQTRKFECQRPVKTT